MENQQLDITERLDPLVESIKLDDILEFGDLVSKIAESAVDSVVVDGVVHPFEMRQNLIEMLEEHICNHLIRVGKGIYRQTNGIPQGSVVSTILCGLYYGQFEISHLEELSKKRRNLMLRYIDDFLFVTPHLNDAVQFMTLLHQGIPQYGIEIQQSKSVTNFDCILDGVEIENISKKYPYFPWCGLLINVHNLDVYADYSKICENSLINSMTMELFPEPGALLLKKAKQEVKNRSHLIFTDQGFNSDFATYVNVYQSFLLCAKRLSIYQRNVIFRTNHNFTAKLVMEVIDFQYSLLAFNSSSHDTMKKSEVCW